MKAGKARISTLTAGDGVETVVLIHGLGGTKSSFYETVSALAPRYTVHAIDLPGFGASSKPARAPYDPAWFARAIVRFLDARGIRRAHLVGNSLGGRIAIEVGLAAPERVNSLSLLTPSMAWRKHRTLVPLVKLLRPELAAIPHTLTSQLVRRQFWSMFGGPDRLHPTVADLAVEEFLAGYRDPAARVAFSAAARNIYLEEPDGPNGFWTRLAGLQPPAMFIWGDHDPLVPLAFCAHVSEVLPERAPGGAERLRPRAAGGDARGLQRAAAGLHRLGAFAGAHARGGAPGSRRSAHPRGPTAQRRRARLRTGRLARHSGLESEGRCHRPAQAQPPGQRRGEAATGAIPRAGSPGPRAPGARCWAPSPGPCSIASSTG